MRPKHDPTPIARVRFQSFLWVAWAGLCVLALCFAAFSLLGVVHVPKIQSYVGTLKPNQSPAQLKLPAGVPLKSMLVKAGEKVHAGQTVAVLDQAAMRAELDHIERRIAVAHILRECLLSSNEADPVDIATLDTKNIEAPSDTELLVLIRTARADCATSRREDKLKRARLERGLEILQERLILVNQKLAMILGVNTDKAKKDVHPVLRAHASVSVALERNDVLQKLQVVKAELDSLRVFQDQARLARVANLSDDVALNLKHQAVLRTYLERPRLTVPQNGMVGRVRPIPAGAQFDEDQTILEVHGEEQAQYSANLRVPLDQVDMLPIGTKVNVSLAGFTKRGPKLRGAVERWTEGDNGTGMRFATARILLSDESQLALADPRNGIALRGVSTASVIHAELEQQTLQETLRQAAFQNGEWAKAFLTHWTGTKEAMLHPM